MLYQLLPSPRPDVNKAAAFYAVIEEELKQLFAHPLEAGELASPQVVEPIRATQIPTFRQQNILTTLRSSGTIYE